MNLEKERMVKVQGIVLVNIATLAWTTNMILGRWLRDQIGPLTLAAARFAVASLCFLILLQRRPVEERRLGQDRWLLLGMGLTGVAIFAPTMYLGLRYTTAINATLINGLGPLITGLLAALLIREPMSKQQIAGAVVGLFGVVILVSEGGFPFWQGLSGNIGDWIVLAAVVLWGLYSILGRQVMRHRSPLSTTAFADFLGLPFLLLAAVWEVRQFPVDLTPRLLGIIIYVGIVPAVIGFFSWNAGLRRLGPGGAMTFYNTLPLYGTLLGFLFLNEPVGLHHLAGGVLIVGGGLWAARRGQ